jgi:hypothetical protein
MRRCRFRTAVAVAVAVLVVLGSLPVSGPDKFLDKITQALPDQAPAKPKQPRKVLIFSKTAGFRHGSIPVGAKAITMMGDKTGAYTAHHTEDEAFFEPAKLKAFDAVFMLNTTGECLRPKSDKKDEALKREEMLKKSLVDFVASGKGLIGVHSATDTYKNWKDYNQMMGGSFDGHSGTPRSRSRTWSRSIRSTRPSAAWTSRLPTRSIRSAPTRRCRRSGSSCSAWTPRRWT